MKALGTVPGNLRYIIAAFALVLCSEHVFAQASPGVQIRPPAPMTYSVGDKLKLSFYEPLAMPDKSNWTSIGKPQLPGPSYYLHPELSGDYTIQSDWTISIPMIGTIRVAHRNAQEVEADLGNAFEKIIGHSGYVSISLLEREPVYIIGPVKQQGAYKFEPGLTPLSLVALAGGVLRDQENPMTVVEAVREAGKEEVATDRLSSLLAQNAVLQAELQGKPVELPARLVRLEGVQQATLLVKAEQAKRASVIQAHSERQKELEVASVAAQNRVSVDESRLPAVADSVHAFQNRMTGITTLYSHGNVDRVMLEQARGDLLNAKNQHAAVLTSIGDDIRDLSQAKLGAVRFEAETKAELEQMISANQREIDELIPSVAVSTGIIGLLKPDPSDDPDTLQFEIVRSSQVLPADVTTPLEPGDLLRVRGRASVTVVSGASDARTLGGLQEHASSEQ
jgi:polysaccharide biosynthesis/export protein ExoF